MEVLGLAAQQVFLSRTSNQRFRPLRTIDFTRHEETPFRAAAFQGIQGTGG
jgi:hypothetical protein